MHIADHHFDLTRLDNALVLELGHPQVSPTIARVQAEANIGSSWDSAVITIEGQIPGASTWHSLNISISADSMTGPILVAGLARVRARVQTVAGEAAGGKRIALIIAASVVPITLTLSDA